MQQIQIDKRLTAQAEDLIRNAVDSGQLIIFPTETVYGLGCNAFDSNSIARISELKRRKSPHPYSVHLGSTAEIEKYAYIESTELSDRIENLLPGPYTLLLAATDAAPADCISKDGKIGIRVPDSDAFRSFYKISKQPLIGTSVNVSGDEPITDIDVMISTFKDDIELILVTDLELSGESSAILDLTIDPPRAIRGHLPKIFEL